jgi:cysteine desulfurase/selenocysteine lyase
MDSAASALKPLCVIKTINDFLSRYGTNPHNVDSSLTYHVYGLVEKTREQLAKLWNTKSEQIIFNSGATEGLNFVADNLKNYLKKNDEIILTYGEHASNLLP